MMAHASSVGHPRRLLARGSLWVVQARRSVAVINSPRQPSTTSHQRPAIVSTDAARESTPSASAIRPRSSEESEVSEYRWLILLGLITAAIMEVLDTTIINVALPQMAGNLGATIQEIAWVSTGYILSNVVVLPMTAFFTATFGRRNYLTGSIIIFIIASFLC